MSLPNVVATAGKAWQTPLGRYAPQASASASEGAAWALVLQLPLEGLLSNGGGVHFVVKRAQGSQPEWLSGPHNKDFFISLDEVTYLAHWVLTAMLFKLVLNLSASAAPVTARAIDASPKLISRLPAVHQRHEENPRCMLAP